MQFGLIGCGNIGKLRAKALTKSSGMALVAVNDLDPTAIIVNIQGDEPLIDPSMINDVAYALLENENLVMSTLKYPITDHKEYTDPKSVDYSNVDVPNAIWHQDHTFTCFAYPTFTAEDCQQIADALVKVIKAYSK